MIYLGKKRILIIDDELETVELLKVRLEASGHEVYTGINGLEGLTQTKKLTPDLIILDIVMPCMDGIELFKKLRQDEAYESIPIMVLTVRGDLEEKLSKLGCDCFVTKPYQAEELVTYVEALLKSRILLAGSRRDFQDLVKPTFPVDRFLVRMVNNPKQIFKELAKLRYHLLVLRIAQTESNPFQFMTKVWKASLNSNMSVIVYSDAAVPGTELGDQRTIHAIKEDWMDRPSVLFYDERIRHEPFSNFVHYHIENMWAITWGKAV